MKTKSKISGYILRSSAAALLFSCVVVAISSAINLPSHPPKFPAPENNTAFGVNGHESASSMVATAIRSNRTLMFEDRVAYQRAIEEVYWRHRIWPKERPDPKPSLDAVMSEAQLEGKVADYLRNSQALEDYWQRPLTAAQLQAEMERMAQHTKQPEVLRELFEALGNDPFVIAECLARPALSERLVTNFYVHDQRFHGELRQRAEEDLLTHPTVEQMKQLSGKFSEIELSKSENGQGETSRTPEHALKLNSREWEETVQKLAGVFNSAGGASVSAFGARRQVAAFQSADMSAHFQNAAAEVHAIIPIQSLSPLQEDEARYYVVAVIEKTKDRLKLATVEWRKEPLESWRARGENQMPKVIAASSANYKLPTTSNGPNGCIDDTWTPTSSTDVLFGRAIHTAVWTGSEMIIWGGFVTYVSNTGSRYNPSTDSWTATSTTNAPSRRAYHMAVGRYNPSTDSWTATSTTNAPSARVRHTAVWTGGEMIVWGGYDDLGPLNTGGRYNPSTDGWTTTSTTNAPSPRGFHTAVWTGSEMILWGGQASFLNFLNTGGKYNPSTDSWTATSTIDAPTARYIHTTVWTGSEMIVWGGFGNSGVLNTGARYNPGADSWTTTSTTNAPTGREWHTAVWTGSEMIVWGGDAGTPFETLNTGGRYNPSTDTWIVTSTTNAPSARVDHTAVWSGSEMIVWGGDSNTGGRYNPSTDSWTATSTGNEPFARQSHTAVWTGSEMIVWGGQDVSISFNTGGRYNPSTDTWTATSTTNAPTGRELHTAVWTGSEMIVWGGLAFEDYLNTGGRYNPGTDSWTATSTTNAPTGREWHTAVWTGTEMIVWGGFDEGTPYLNTGGTYNSGTDSWTTTSTINAPTARYHHTAVWTGSEMIVSGGVNDSGGLNTGGRYCAQSGPPPSPTPTATATGTPTLTPTPTPTATATATATFTPTPRPPLSPRPRPTPAPRP